ncbi:MAG: protein arginine kinase [Eubacteriales bacterium]|nr:protein arginine kinase [Eubacteriales bacterium]
MTWYIDKGPESDVIVSSRIRLARNLTQFPFPHRMDNQQAKQAADEIVDAFLNHDEKQRHDFLTLDLETLNEIDRMALVEKHLVSEDLARVGKNHRVIISRDESLSIMINEEDHIRIQAMQAGLDLEGAFALASGASRQLEDNLNIAYSEQFGFLTACPTNTGTGMRASAMAHLPGLVMTGKIRTIVDSLSKMSFAVRGYHGEGSKSQGNVFQISNQLTLGLSEEDLINDLKRMLNQLIEQERKARRAIYRSRPVFVEDKIMRSYGVLLKARQMANDEALNLLSDLRLGLALGLIHGISESEVNRLIASIGPASIQKTHGQPMTPEERDIARATAIRNLLGEQPAN